MQVLIKIKWQSFSVCSSLQHKSINKRDIDHSYGLLALWKTVTRPHIFEAMTGSWLKNICFISITPVKAPSLLQINRGVFRSSLRPLYHKSFYRTCQLHGLPIPLYNILPILFSTADRLFVFCGIMLSDYVPSIWGKTLANVTSVKRSSLTYEYNQESIPKLLRECWCRNQLRSQFSGRRRGEEWRLPGGRGRRLTVEARDVSTNRLWVGSSLLTVEDAAIVCDFWLCWLIDFRLSFLFAVVALFLWVMFTRNFNNAGCLWLFMVPTRCLPNSSSSMTSTPVI